MCVAITLEPGAKLLLDELEKMNRANADGVGVAWAWQGVVYWSKTTTVDPKEVMDLIDGWNNCPRLVHFRLATAGGTKPELCHPFEISDRANCAPEGQGKRIMIHNGHWSRWSEIAKLLDDEGLLPDKGPWSDSRLAAFLAAQDPDWLVALGGRVGLLDSSGNIQRLGDWTQLREGIYVSNKIWESCTVKRGGYGGYKSWPGWHGTGDWDGDTGEAIQGLVSDHPGRTDSTNLRGVTHIGKDHGKEKKKEEKHARGRHYEHGHWWDASKGRWLKWDSVAQTTVDVTSEHPDGTKPEDENGHYAG